MGTKPPLHASVAVLLFLMVYLGSSVEYIVTTCETADSTFVCNIIIVKNFQNLQPYIGDAYGPMLCPGNFRILATPLHLICVRLV